MANDDRVLTFDDLRGKGWPFSREWTYRLMVAGKFPKAFKASEGGRKNLWLERDIDRFMSDRAKTAGQ